MTSAPKHYAAPAMAVRTAAILFLFVVVFTGLLSAVYKSTRPVIEATAREERLRLLNEVLPSADYDNDLVAEALVLPPTAELGLKEPSTLYRARRAGQPVAAIFDAVAPDGYAGRIRLLVAIRFDGSIAGVRVTQHKETPGLGDYIEPKKDRNKTRPWITQFNGLALATTDDKAWRVIKDGGRLEYYAGATISPRAIARAVHKAARWFDANRGPLFAAAGGQP
jgi:electron transport complex protein RnfG